MLKELNKKIHMFKKFRTLVNNITSRQIIPTSTIISNNKEVTTNYLIYESSNNIILKEIPQWPTTIIFHIHDYTVWYAVGKIMYIEDQLEYETEKYICIGAVNSKFNKIKRAMVKSVVDKSNDIFVKTIHIDINFYDNNSYKILGNFIVYNCKDAKIIVFQRHNKQKLPRKMYTLNDMILLIFRNHVMILDNKDSHNNNYIGIINNNQMINCVNNDKKALHNDILKMARNEYVNVIHSYNTYETLYKYTVNNFT